MGAHNLAKTPPVRRPRWLRIQCPGRMGFELLSSHCSPIAKENVSRMPKRSWPGWRSSQRTLPFQSAAGTTPPFERKSPRKRFFEVRPSKSVPRLVGIGGKCTPKVKLQLGTISPSVSTRHRFCCYACGRKERP